MINYNIDNIRTLFLSGMNATEIGVKVGISTHRVKKALNSIGFRPKDQKSIILNENADRIKKLRNEGRTVKEISAKFGISSHTVSKFLFSLGINPKERTMDKLKPYREEVINLFKGGESCASIGRTFKVSTTTVTNFLNKEGLWKKIGRGELGRHGPDVASKAIECYKSGKLISSICEELSISKTAFFRIISSNGIDLRGGRKESPSKEKLLKAAKGREKSQSLTKNESFVADILRSNGQEFIPQFAIDIYNVDFFFPDCGVVLEVCNRGTFMKYLRDGTHAKRIKYLGECGLNVFVIGANDFVDALAVNQFLFWLDFIRSSKPAIAEYRMIRGAGDLVSCGKIDLNHLAAISSSV